MKNKILSDVLALVFVFSLGWVSNEIFFLFKEQKPKRLPQYIDLSNIDISNCEEDFSVNKDGVKTFEHWSVFPDDKTFYITSYKSDTSVKDCADLFNRFKRSNQPGDFKAKYSIEPQNKK